MVSAADFSAFVTVMFWSAVAMLGLSVALVALLLVVRIRAVVRRRHTERLVVNWRAVFTGVLPNRPSRIARHDVFTILNLWADFHRVQSNGGGVPSQALLAVASAQGFERLAARLLNRGDAADRLVALTFFEYCPVASRVNKIRTCASSAFGEVSLAAHRALVATDPNMMHELADAIAERGDFRERTVEEALRAIGSEAASLPMVESARSHEHAERVRILRYFALLDAATARSAVREILATDDDPDVIAAALKVLTGISLLADRALVQRFLDHPAAAIRIAAIGALVPIRDAPDRRTLLGLLRDRDADVRYRAAQALVQCSALDGTESDLRRDVTDRYGRDAFALAMLERSLIEVLQFVAAENGGPDMLADEGRRPVEWRRMDALRSEN